MKPWFCVWVFLVVAGQVSASQATDVARQLMAVWETGKTEQLDDFVAEDAVYDDVPSAYVFEGRDGFKSYVQHVHSWASDIQIEILAAHGNETAAYVEWEMRAVQDRPIRGRVKEATGRRFVLRGLTLVEVEDGRIRRAADYIDVLGFVLQLGARVELPGGVVLGGEKPTDMPRPED